jgi:hypothetical protein
MLTTSKNEKMFLNVFDNPENSDFTIKLTNSYNGSEIHSVTVTNASKLFHIQKKLHCKNPILIPELVLLSSETTQHRFQCTRVRPAQCKIGNPFRRKKSINQRQYPPTKDVDVH